MSLWVRYETATRRVRHLSQPPFTGPAPAGEADVLIARERPPDLPQRLRLTQAGDDVVVEIPLEEQQSEAARLARLAILRQEPSVLTLAQRVERLEVALNLEKGVT